MSTILHRNNECIYRIRECIIFRRNLLRFSRCLFGLLDNDFTTIETSLSCSLDTLFSPVLSLSVAINWQTLSLIANSLCALYCARKRIPGLKAFRGALQLRRSASDYYCGRKGKRFQCCHHCAKVNSGYKRGREEWNAVAMDYS